ncbi:MAG: ROK family protein [Bacteroidales bacterium]|nr:ROK family protein [Bacteroidales bacterium]
MKVFIGIDIGGTNVNIGMVSEEKQVLDETVIGTEPEKGPENALNRVASAVHQILKAGQKNADYKGMGVGLPGLLDIENGCIIEASNLPGWQHYGITGFFKKHFKIPVFMENDANLAALGEYWLGAGQGSDNMFMVTLGSGIGGALLSNGKIMRLHPMAGEFGHMIIDKKGFPCTCGRKGCLETFVSKHGFQRLVRERLYKHPDSSLQNYALAAITPPIIAAHASQGDMLANRIFDEAGEALGIALSNLINLTGVTCIICGGGIANAWDLLQKPVMSSLEQNVFASIFSGVKIRKAALGEKAGFMGAAYLAANSV